MKRLLILLGTMIAGCTSLPIIDVPSLNHNSRVNYLVLHFTSEDFAESLRLLTQRTEYPVSVHYLVPETGDATYDRRTLRIHRLVAENRRAWHAGRSYWAGADALNDTSIGIEIVNRSACVNNDPDTESPSPEDQTCNMLAFPHEQVDLVIRLATDILDRNPDIDPVDVIGHGDIAPGRRVDPGPLFPWRRLYDHGIGAWYDDESVARYVKAFSSDFPELRRIQRALNAYGYLIELTGENDVQTRFVVRAFQMHFRPEMTSGQIDNETVAILYALLEKYRPELLEDLLTGE
ncbi:MAG: N-acetylmuramoyl-L-alanine amidase [Proteobacteria bacterium]|nr:N-acetylmuramoyl-L-alanine amidase [Pseudomonadota bacterium]